MLNDRFSLYRPWIPVCKAIEAEAIRGISLPGPVLDIGCGNGTFASYYLKEKADTGLDYDPKAVAGARKKGIYREVVVGDASDLPFENDRFQSIVSICVIEHIPDISKVLSNTFRVLKKGGGFVFTVPSVDFGKFLFGARLLSLFGLKGPAKRYADSKNDRSGHLHVYDSVEWTRLLNKSGFDVEDISYIFPGDAVFLWSFFHSLPFRIIFLPFRLLRDLKIKFVDNILRSILSLFLSGWISRRSHPSKTSGGYLLITAKK